MKQERRDKDRVPLLQHPANQDNQHVSIMHGHSSTSWLPQPVQNKPSSPWAACYSQCDFPNGHNGGQHHLLARGGLESGEVCIQLQLRRKSILVLVKGSNVTLGVMDAEGMSLVG